MHVRKTAAIGVERQLPAGGGVAFGDKAPASLRGNQLSSPPRKRGSRARPNSLRPWIPASAGVTGRGDHRRLDRLAGAEEVDRPPVRCQGQALREVAGVLGRDQDQRAAAVGQAETHGSIRVRPQASNPPASRVAILAPAVSAVAAISASNASIGLPTRRRATTISAYRAAAAPS